MNPYVSTIIKGSSERSTNRLHILDLKTQRAQAEADMFFEAIERTAEIESTDDGGLAALFQVYHTQMTIGLSSGSGTTTTRLPDDWFDDWFSTSSAPSNASDSDILYQSRL
jgi:hypothetical protein